MKYSIVIPVYFGENCVAPLLDKIKDFFETTSYSYEVIFVYDCGPDNSWKVLQELKEKNPNLVKIIKLSRNFGQHNALMCGFNFAQGDFIITMDEDLQHNPFDIAKLIEKQASGNYDLVYGTYDELKHSGFRNLTSRMMKKLISASIPELSLDYSAFRLIKSSVAKSITQMQNSYTFLDGYLSWVTCNIGSCVISHNERFAGKSSYSVKKLIEHSINIFVTFSNYPIRLVTKFSILLFVLNCFFALYILGRKLMYDDFAAGFPSLILVLIFGFSLVLLSIGIVGEYIYRINLKTTKRPNYNIDIIR